MANNLEFSKKRIQRIKNLSNEFFDGQARDSKWSDDELFVRLTSHLNEKVLGWKLDEVKEALCEVENLHLKLGELGRMNKQQVSNANERVYLLMSMFIERDPNG